MEDEQELQELRLLAVQDFKSALCSQSPQEAAATLRGYLAELRGAPEDVLLQLAAAFRSAAMAAVRGTAAPAAALQPLLELQQLLLGIVGPSSAAVAELRGAWADGAAALLYGPAAGEPAEAAVDRLIRCQGMLAILLASALPPPASYMQARSLLTCLLHLLLLPPSDLPGGVVEQLTALAVPPWFGRDFNHAKQQQAAAFEAFLAVVQHRSVAHRLASSSSGGISVMAAAAAAHGPPTSCTPEAALRFLMLFRAPLPTVTDSWWAHFAAVLHGVVQLAQSGGALALRRPSTQALLRCLCTQDTAHMAVQLVLAHPSFQLEAASASAGGGGDAGGGRKRVGGARQKAGKGGAGAGPRQALAQAAALMAHDVPAFLCGCCELLRPEANALLATRVEALAAMDRAAGRYLDEHDGEEGAALRLWPPAALEQLLYVLRSDPSIRVRREAVRLLSSVAVGMGTAQEAALLWAVVLRCRDKDEAVRKEAFALLAQFPQASLERHLSLPDWQALLDVGLAGPLPTGGSKGGSGGRAVSKHAVAIQGTSQQLLLRYLGLEGGVTGGEEGAGSQEGSQLEVGEEESVPLSDEEDDGDVEEVGQQEGGTAGSGSGGDDPPAWVGRLQALQELPPHGDGCAVALHLRSAWREALAAALEPVQVALINAQVEGAEEGKEEEDAMWG